MRVLLLLGLVACALMAACARHSPEVLAHGRFKAVTVYRPQGNVQEVVLLLSGDGGWQLDTDRMAKVLQAHGALVLGIDEPALLASFTQEKSECFFPDGDLENLSHYVQAYYRLPTYITPVLGGYSAGATLAYATAAQAPPGIFAGVLTLGFTPDYETTTPFCKGAGQHFVVRADGKGLTLLPDPKLALRWVDVHGVQDSVCPAPDAAAFIARIHNAQISLVPGVEHDFADPRKWSAQLRAALDAVSAGTHVAQPVAPLTLKDLPLIEVPHTGTGNDDLFAVLLSGDGGWAGIDKDVANSLAERGIPVVGWDTLRYFWTARTPEGLARDLDRTLDYYVTAWDRPRALLIGYSQGADVLPFAVNRLPATCAVEYLRRRCWDWDAMPPSSSICPTGWGLPLACRFCPSTRRCPAPRRCVYSAPAIRIRCARIFRPELPARPSWPVAITLMATTTVSHTRF